MRPIRTGDLYLGNRWSVSALLAKTIDSEAAWSEAGIFVVDKTDPEETEVYVYFVDQQVEKVLLSDLLAEGNLQSAAHRALRDAKVNQIAGIEEFLRGAVGMNGLTIEKSLEVALPVNDGSQRTSSGQKINDKGRALTHVSRTKRGYHSADLVASTLAAVGLLIYNPDLQLSDLQQGGPLDQLYEGENPLLPTSKVDPDLVVSLAQHEVIEFMHHYLEKVPQANLHNVKAFREGRTKLGRQFLAAAGKPEEAEIPLVAPSYLEHHSVPDLAGANRGAANKKAEKISSDTLDRRLRKQQEALDKLPKPQPGFRK